MSGRYPLSAISTPTRPARRPNREAPRSGASRQQACKPDSVEGDHLSRPPVPRWLERCTRLLGGPRRRSLFHLAPDGVWRAAVSPQRWWALTPPFHPYRQRLRRVFRCRRSPFCATFRRLSPPGISPASCPSVSGLSSSRERLAVTRPALSIVAATLRCSGTPPGTRDRRPFLLGGGRTPRTRGIPGSRRAEERTTPARAS